MKLPFGESQQKHETKPWINSRVSAVFDGRKLRESFQGRLGSLRKPRDAKARGAREAQSWSSLDHGTLLGPGVDPFFGDVTGNLSSNKQYMVIFEG
jgi:hypothetical protein